MLPLGFATNVIDSITLSVWRREIFFFFFINYTYLFIIQLISSIYIYVNLIIKDQY